MHTDDLEIRPSLPHDATTWAEMFYEIHKDPTESCGPFTNEQCQTTAVNYCGRKNTGADCVLTAFLGGVASGFIQARKDDPRIGQHGWYIRGVETRPSYRRRGVARQLVQAIVAQAVQDHCTVYAAISHQNTASIQLFESCGFTRVTDVGKFSDNTHVFCKRSND